MHNDNTLPPTILVVFGITGDLSHRYLLPALAQIEGIGKLPNNFKIIGVSRRPINKEGLFHEGERSLDKYAESFQMDLENPDSYKELKEKLDEADKNHNSKPEIIYYLSVPPAGVLPIIRHLGEAGLNTPETKLLLEKPFGVDLESAHEVIAETERYFPEEQVYRIDHYLAKEMAQNIIVFLGSNTLFRNVWSNKFVEKIEINIIEKIGIEGRASFYEPTGALRDIIQNHGLQLAALTLMEPCSGVFEFGELPARRLAALQNLQAKTDEPVFRAQYEGYQNEVENPGSLTETFVSLTLESADPRWESVPIRLNTGKNFNEKSTEICIYFKATEASEANRLVLHVQPHEGVELDLWVKQPGYERKLQKLPLQFNYEQHFKERLPEAYEQVLVDAMQSNHSLFTSSEEVLASWKILQPIQSKWEMDKSSLHLYKPGSTLGEVLKAAKIST